jgi:hypothetical protein
MHQGIGSGVEVVLEHRLDRKPSSDLPRVIYFQSLLGAERHQTEIGEGLVQRAADAAVYDAECHGIAPAARNEAVIADASRDL